jgi:type 1 glutamine amidotransferase
MSSARSDQPAPGIAQALLAWAATGALLAGDSLAQSAETPVSRPAPKKQRVLIVTGEDYAGHDWRMTTPVLKAAMEADPRLRVEVLWELDKLSERDLGPYAAVVLHFKNYDPDVPGRAAFDALRDFVESGGGMVLAHFACGAFEEFREDYEELAGRVWFGARPPPGRGQHDPHGPFTVHPTGIDHPVTSGLGAFETTDELYTCLVGDGPIEVLAEAVSARDGRRYPMAFALRPGEGRVFHCVLGHDAEALGKAPVAELYRRGTAWAAGLDPATQRDGASWAFVSMPDFLNVDTAYPQPGWEPALSYILESVRAEGPEFLLVAGDLVMGRWWSEELIAAHAPPTYRAWTERMKAHGLRFYAALGDHEIGDDPWPPERAALVPRFKAAFREHLGMPRNGPPGMEGTAFWWRHGNALFVAVDVFEETDGGPHGLIEPQVTGAQLEWLRRVLVEHADARHKIVMGHTPILGPLRQWSSSGLVLDGGRDSPLWRTMVEHGVDLYLCGEVHVINCHRRDGVQQVAHGGLLGYNTRTSYLVCRVFEDRLELELEEIDVLASGERLAQVGDNRPLERVEIPLEFRARGFVTVGRLVIDKSGDRKVFTDVAGWFLPTYEPTQRETYKPFGQDAPPRITAEPPSEQQRDPEEEGPP